jgi:acyl-CoA thioesterase FadM
MREEKFTPPDGAFTRSVPIRFSHCDPAGIVYFPHYFDMFNGVIEDWYKDELKHDYAALVMGERFGFPFVHIECDFKIPSLMGEVIELTLLVDRIGRSSLGIVVVCHRDDVARDPQAGAIAAAAARGDRGLSGEDGGALTRRCPWTKNRIAGRQVIRQRVDRCALSFAAWRSWPRSVPTGSLMKFGRPPAPMS